MQYIQIPYTESINPFSYSNGIKYQFLTNMSNHIDNNSFNYQYDLLPSVTEQKTPDKYHSISKVLIKTYF